MFKFGESYPKDIVKKVIQDYDNGFTYAEITRRYAVSHQTISKWIKNGGIKQKRKSYDWERIKKELI